MTYLTTAIVLLRIHFNASSMQMFHIPVVHVDFEMKLCGTETAVICRNISHKIDVFHGSISSVDWEVIYSESDSQTPFGLFHFTQAIL